MKKAMFIRNIIIELGGIQQAKTLGAQAVLDLAKQRLYDLYQESNTSLDDRKVLTIMDVHRTMFKMREAAGTSNKRPVINSRPCKTIKEIDIPEGSSMVSSSFEGRAKEISHISVYPDGDRIGITLAVKNSNAVVIVLQNAMALQLVQGIESLLTTDPDFSKKD